MISDNPIIHNACIIVEGIAFEITNDNNIKKILASDIYNPNYKASFVLRNHDLILSVSSFREKEREQVLLEAVHINSSILIDEVQNA